MSRLRKVIEFLGLGAPHDPVTFRDVPPAPRPLDKEAEIKKVHTQFVGELLAGQRKSWEIRHELAGQALKLVSGD